MPIYKPYHNYNPNTYSREHCCKKLHVAFGRVPGSTSNNGLSQEPEALLKNELFHLRFSNSFTSTRPLRYLIYVCLLLNMGWLMILFKYGCNKQGFTTDSYSIDWPINVYLKQNVFEHNGWFTFSHVFRMSATYKIEQNIFGVIFLPRELIMLGANYFAIKIFFKSFV